MSNVLSSLAGALNPLTPFEHIADLGNTLGNIVGDVRANGADTPIKFYGNWGGPHYGGGQPIDDLDRAFQQHDKGYGDRGYFDTATDINFSTTAGLNVFNPDATNRERFYGAVAAGIFAGLAPVSSVYTSLWNPIDKADSVPEAIVNVATAPVKTAVAVVEGTVNAVTNAIGNLFSW
jgi:hypothetical protein